MKFLRLLIAGAFALAPLTFAAPQSAQAAILTVFDDDFNADSAGVSGYVTVTDLNKWSLLQGNVDILGTAYGCTGCIDLDGSSSPDTAVLQTKEILHFTNGLLYTFSLFFSGGSQEETVMVYAGGSVSFKAGNGASVWTVTTPSVGDFDLQLRISLGGPVDNSGPYLDRVLITYDDGMSAVPLPASAPLLLAGMGALGWMRRRTTKA